MNTATLTRMPSFDLGKAGDSLSCSYSLAYDGLLNSMAELFVEAYFNLSSVCYYTERMENSRIQKQANVRVLTRLVNKFQSSVQDCALGLSRCLAESVRSLEIKENSQDIVNLNKIINGHDYTPIKENLIFDSRLSQVDYCIASFRTAFHTIMFRRSQNSSSSPAIGPVGDLPAVQGLAESNLSGQERNSSGSPVPRPFPNLKDTVFAKYFNLSKPEEKRPTQVTAERDTVVPSRVPSKMPKPKNLDESDEVFKLVSNEKRQMDSIEKDFNKMFETQLPVDEHSVKSHQLLPSKEARSKNNVLEIIEKARRSTQLAPKQRQVATGLRERKGRQTLVDITDKSLDKRSLDKFFSSVQQTNNNSEARNNSKGKSAIDIFGFRFRSTAVNIPYASSHRRRKSKNVATAEVNKSSKIAPSSARGMADVAQLKTKLFKLNSTLNNLKDRSRSPLESVHRESVSDTSIKKADYSVQLSKPCSRLCLNRTGRTLYIFGSGADEIQWAMPSTLKITGKSSILRDNDVEGTVLGVEMVPDQNMAVATSTRLLILSTKPVMSILRDFSFQGNKPISENSSFNLLSAIEDSKNLYWWSNEGCMCVISMESLNLSHQINNIYNLYDYSLRDYYVLKGGSEMICLLEPTLSGGQQHQQLLRFDILNRKQLSITTLMSTENQQPRLEGVQELYTSLQRVETFSLSLNSTAQGVMALAGSVRFHAFDNISVPSVTLCRISGQKQPEKLNSKVFSDLIGPIKHIHFLDAGTVASKGLYMYAATDEREQLLIVRATAGEQVLIRNVSLHSDTINNILVSERDVYTTSKDSRIARTRLETFVNTVN